MRVLIVGGGKVGFYLAKTLQEHGHTPVIIELKRSHSTRLANDLDLPVICGDGTSVDVLRTAQPETCDVLVAVTGRDDCNLIACQIAKRLFAVPKTIARVNNPKNVEIMNLLGVDISLSATDTLSRLIEREVDTFSIRQLASLNRGEASLNEFKLPDPYDLHNTPLSSLPLPQDAVLVTITRKSGELVIPRGNTCLQNGDTVTAICKNSALHALSKTLRIRNH